MDDKELFNSDLFVGIKNDTNMPLINTDIAFNDKRIHKMLFRDSWHAGRNGWELTKTHKKYWWIIAESELRKLPKKEYKALEKIYDKRIAKYGRPGICAYDVSKFPV